MSPSCANLRENYRPHRHDRLRLDRQRHAAADRAAFRIRQVAHRRHRPGRGPQGLARQHGVRFIQQGITRDNYREVLVPLLTEGGGQGFCVNLSVDTSSLDIMDAVPRNRRALYRHRRRAVARLLFRREDRPGSALQLCAARNAAGRQAQEPGRARPRSPAAAPIPAWCPGSSSRRCSISPRDTNTLNSTSRRAAKAWASLMQKARRQGHPYRRARHPALQEAESR